MERNASQGEKRQPQVQKENKEGNSKDRQIEGTTDGDDFYWSDAEEMMADLDLTNLQDDIPEGTILTISTASSEEIDKDFQEEIGTLTELQEETFLKEPLDVQRQSRNGKNNVDIFKRKSERSARSPKRSIPEDRESEDENAKKKLK